MRKLIPLASLITLASALTADVVASTAATTPTTHAFTGTVLSDDIISSGTSFENAYKITSSADGTGAGWNEGSNSGTTLPLSGQARNLNYLADGVNPISQKYSIGPANASGIAVLTGTGKCIAGGSGVFKHETCTFTETRTLNVNRHLRGQAQGDVHAVTARAGPAKLRATIRIGDTDRQQRAFGPPSHSPCGCESGRFLPTKRSSR